MSPETVDTPDRLEQTVKWFVVSEELVRQNGLVLAAVSGGADSMAMLSILHKLSKSLQFRVAVGHLDHGLRPEADEDRRLVEEFTRSLSLPFHTGNEDVRGLARDSGDTIEEAARKARYEFLHQVADRIRADHIATGHTRNDQVETVVMRILRGTGVRGLAGIPKRRGRVIRPLLLLGRVETHSYCRSTGVPFNNDPSNTDRRYFRNRIRHDLLPLLETHYNTGVEENVLRLAQNAQSVIKTIRVKTDPLIEKHFKQVSPDKWMFNTSQIGGLDDTSIVVLFGDLFLEKLSCSTDFSRAHFDGLVRLVKSTHGSGKMLSLPGFTVKREYENLLITRRLAQTVVRPSLDHWDHRATLSLPGDTQATGIVVKIAILDRVALDESTLKASESEAYFDRGTIHPPLVLRRPAPGDRMQPFGMQGSKKLSDIFIDKKIPARKRSSSLVITDADGILWLVGVTTRETSRVGAGTREVVRILIEKQ